MMSTDRSAESVDESLSDVDEASWGMFRMKTTLRHLGA